MQKEHEYWRAKAADRHAACIRVASRCYDIIGLGAAQQAALGPRSTWPSPWPELHPAAVGQRVRIIRIYADHSSSGPWSIVGLVGTLANASRVPPSIGSTYHVRIDHGCLHGVYGATEIGWP